MRLPGTAIDRVVEDSGGGVDGFQENFQRRTGIVAGGRRENDARERGDAGAGVGEEDDGTGGIQLARERVRGVGRHGEVVDAAVTEAGGGAAVGEGGDAGVAGVERGREGPVFHPAALQFGGVGGDEGFAAEGEEIGVERCLGRERDGAGSDAGVVGAVPTHAVVGGQAVAGAEENRAAVGGGQDGFEVEAVEIDGFEEHRGVGAGEVVEARAAGGIAPDDEETGEQFFEHVHLSDRARQRVGGAVEHGERGLGDVVDPIDIGDARGAQAGRGRLPEEHGGGAVVDADRAGVVAEGTGGEFGVGREAGDFADEGGRVRGVLEDLEARAGAGGVVGEHADGGRDEGMTVERRGVAGVGARFAGPQVFRARLELRAGE